MRQVIEAREPLVVPDLLQHPVFGKDVFPPAGTLRGYVGVPILSRDGAIDGALCVFDTEPLTLDARAVDALSDAAERLAVELHAGYERIQTHERFTALSRLALTDAVTSLANRRGGEEAFAREVSRARRSGSPLSLVLFDIDHFKQINDRAGHAVGDRVLRGISDILSASQRGSDLAMRWGGEEFLVLLPDVGLSGARAFAERVPGERAEPRGRRSRPDHRVSGGRRASARRGRCRRAGARRRKPLSRQGSGAQPRRMRRSARVLSRGVVLARRMIPYRR